MQNENSNDVFDSLNDEIAKAYKNDKD